MSNKSRARKNKRIQLVSKDELRIARYNHTLEIATRRVTKSFGTYPVLLINPRANGRIYARGGLKKAISSIKDGIKGSLSHRAQCVAFDPDDKWLEDLISKHGLNAFVPTHLQPQALRDSFTNPSFSIAARGMEEGDGFEIMTWDAVENSEISDTLNAFKHWQEDMLGQCGIVPELLEMKNEVGFASQYIAPIPKNTPKEEPQRYASLISPQRQRECQTPQHIIDTLYGNREIPIDDSKITEHKTASQLIQERLLHEKEERRTLKSIEQIQSSLGLSKPFDHFYLKAPITVYEFFEHYLTILPDGRWLPKPELRDAPIDMLKTPYKSGPFMLAVVTANEDTEWRVQLENYGYARMEINHQEIQFASGEPNFKQVKRYFLIVLESKLSHNCLKGFNIGQPFHITDLLLENKS